jgi:hypothetical protein
MSIYVRSITKNNFFLDLDRERIKNVKCVKKKHFMQLHHIEIHSNNKDIVSDTIDLIWFVFES